MLSELITQIKSVIQSEINGIHTAIPAKIVSFDPEKCEAEVLPYGQFKTPNGEEIPYPQLSGVPVMFLQSANQNAAIIFPVKPDDECLLIMSEHTLEIWRKNTTEFNRDLRFDLTNAVAIPGLFAKPHRLVKTACEKNAVIIDGDVYITGEIRRLEQEIGNGGGE